MSPGPLVIQMVTGSLRNFPGPVRLETAGEMIVLGINRRATRAHRIFDVLAALVVPSEFLDQLDRARVSGGRVGPGSDRSYGLSVNLIGHSAVDHVEVLLGEDDIRFPSREQLRLGRCSHETDENWEKRFDRYRHGRPPSIVHRRKSRAQLPVPNYTSPP